MRAESAFTWLPFDTAEPSDGVQILVCTSDAPPCVGEAWWRNDHDGELKLWWANQGPDVYFADPIEDSNAPIAWWAPMPKPPENANAG